MVSTWPWSTDRTTSDKEAAEAGWAGPAREEGQGGEVRARGQLLSGTKSNKVTCFPFKVGRASILFIPD